MRECARVSLENPLLKCTCSAIIKYGFCIETYGSSVFEFNANFDDDGIMRGKCCLFECEVYRGEIIETICILSLSLSLSLYWKIRSHFSVFFHNFVVNSEIF